MHQLRDRLAVSSHLICYLTCCRAMWVCSKGCLVLELPAVTVYNFALHLFHGIVYLFTKNIH